MKSKTEIRIPKKVRIGQLVCPITVAETSADVYGRFNRATQDIIINQDITGEDLLRLTLIHEAIHAMESNNTSIDTISEEQIDNLALGVYSLIKDNKKLVEWIQNV